MVYDIYGNPVTSVNAVLSKPVYRTIAHRGVRDIAGIHENTLASFKRAKEKGYRFIETDIMPTSDNVMLLSHDNVKTFNEGTVTIGNTTYANLSGYTVGSGDYATNLTRLDDFILFCKVAEIHPYLELKGIYTKERVKMCMDIVSNFGMDDNVTWLSNTLNMLSYVRSYKADASVCWLPSTTSIDSSLPTVKSFADSGEMIVSSAMANVSNSFIQSILATGAKTGAWTLHDTTKVREFIDYGITEFTCEDVTELDVIYAI